MNKLFLIVAMFVLVSACSIGKKCTYTQDGTKLSSYVWFYKDKPIDLDKNRLKTMLKGLYVEASNMEM